MSVKKVKIFSRILKVKIINVLNFYLTVEEVECANESKLLCMRELLIYYT